MALSYEDIVQGAYSSIGRTGMGNAAGQIDTEGYNFWLDALKAGVVSPDQLYANFNQSVAATIQQQPQAANSQAVAAYIEANPLATQIDPKKVVAVGDSTTWGYNQGNQVAENMVTTAQKALGSDYSVSNLGINSTTAGDFLNSSDFDKALSSGAGTVVLNYGMNEAYRNEDPATFANNLLTAVQTLQAVGKKVILQTPNSTSSTDAWAQNVGTYADVVRSVSQQTGSTLDDKYTYTSGLSNATSAADPVHPTAATYGLLGTNLADAIKTTTTGVAPKAISVTPPVAAAQTPSLLDNQATAGTVAGATTAPEDIVTKIKNQILAQGTSSQWSGQGLGSPEANAADMARLLSDAGITDIKQFGVIPDLEPVVPIDTLYNGKRVFTQTDEDGKTSSYIYEPTGKTLTYNSTDTGEYTSPEMRVVEVPKDAKLETVYGVARDGGGEYGSSYVPVDQSKIKTVDGKLVGDTGKTTFGNKLTGQAIANNYETGADAFGGTFAGKGKTGYRVQFAPDGTPVFYTGGESSSEFKQYAPLLAIASLGLAAPSLFAAGAPTAGAAGLSALDAGLGVYGTGAAGTAGGIAGGLSALDAGMGVYGTGGTAGGLAGGLSALDAGMGVYPSTGNIGLSALDAGLGVYPNTGNIGLSALDAGMSVYPNTGNIIPSALDAGMGVYPNTGNIIPSALDAGMGVYPNTGNIGLSALDAGMGVYGTGGTVLPSTGVGTGLENILSNLTPGQIANIVGGVGGLLGGAALTSGGGTGGTGGVGALPTQRVPLNTADYYNAIQQNYNRLLPAVPRDVATPLAQWYNSTYGA